jgi:hypothetical protein
LAADEPNDSDREGVAEIASLVVSGTPETAETSDSAQAQATTLTQETTATEATESEQVTLQDSSEDSEAPKNITITESQAATVTRTECVPVTTTGSRLRKMRCTTETEGDKRYREQQARDYLRRMEEQSTIAAPPSHPYIQSGMPGL